jgi:hypothetical protein
VTITQPPALDDFLRQFHGAQGVVLLFVILLVIAMVAVALLSAGNFGVTKASRGVKPMVDEVARETALKAINRQPLRQWQDPAAKGFRRDVAHDQHYNTEVVTFSRSDRR